MGEKHDAMWGVDAGERIAQLEAEVGRLKEWQSYLSLRLQKRDVQVTAQSAELTRLRAEVERAYNVMVDAHSQLLYGGTAAHKRNALKIMQQYFAERRAALAAEGKGGE